MHRPYIHRLNGHRCHNTVENANEIDHRIVVDYIYLLEPLYNKHERLPTPAAARSISSSSTSGRRLCPSTTRWCSSGFWIPTTTSSRPTTATTSRTWIYASSTTTWWGHEPTQSSHGWHVVSTAPSTCWWDATRVSPMVFTIHVIFVKLFGTYCDILEGISGELITNSVFFSATVHLPLVSLPRILLVVRLGE